MKTVHDYLNDLPEPLRSECLGAINEHAFGYTATDLEDALEFVYWNDTNVPNYVIYAIEEVFELPFCDDDSIAYRHIEGIVDQWVKRESYEKLYN